MAIFLVYQIDKKGDLDRWKNITGILGTLVAAIALLWAAFTYFGNSRVQKTLSAANIYQEHMKMSIAHPGLADGRIAPKNPGEDFCPSTVEDVQKMNDYEKYRWFVGHALYSFETILEVEDDPAWNSTVDAFIRDHHTYIGSYDDNHKGFPCWRYSDKLQKRLNKIFIEKTCPNAPETEPPPPLKDQCPNVLRDEKKEL
jgi:hypothetical protein